MATVELVLASKARAATSHFRFLALAGQRLLHLPSTISSLQKGARAPRLERIAFVMHIPPPHDESDQTNGTSQMSYAGDLTTSNYWEKVWAAAPDAEGLRAQLQKVTQWKYDRMVRRMFQTVRPDGDLLELGCAPGHKLERIHRLRPEMRLSGIDFAEEGCRATSKLLRRMGLPGNVFHDDVRTAELPNRFDVVTSFGLIEHFDDPVEIVRCHARFCRPGGTVAVALPNFCSPMVRFFADRFCPENLAIHNLNIMNRRVLTKVMNDAGLKSVQVGGDGGNQLHLLISRQDWASRTYATLGRIWNVGAIVVPPQLGWHSYFWAIGQVA